MVYQDRPRTLIQLFAEALSDFTQLFQSEIRLVRAEFDEKISRIANGGTFIGIGAVAALVALFILAQAIVLWLAVAGLPQQWGYLIVGVVLAAIAGGALMKGINDLKSTSLVPDRTIHQVRADFTTMKDHVQ